jgi:hypothetical protein
LVGRRWRWRWRWREDFWGFWEGGGGNARNNFSGVEWNRAETGGAVAKLLLGWMGWDGMMGWDVPLLEVARKESDGVLSVLRGERLFRGRGGS